MRPDVVERLREAMEADDLQAVVAISPENFAYLTGFVVPSQPLMRWRHAMALVAREGPGTLVAVDMEASTVRERAGDTPVRTWGEFSDDPMETLAEALAAAGLAGGRIGLEFKYLPAGDFQSLARRLPGATFVPVDATLDRLRQAKSGEEIALLRRLARIADRAISDAFRAVRAGSSELELAAALTGSVYAQGAEQFKLMIVATGERSRLPNVGPSERRLQPGDVCRVEIFPVIGGYHAGVCRTAVVERAPPEAARIYANLAECRAELLRALRPGASTRGIYEAFLARFGELGLPPISFVGHGIGLHLHEEPYLGPYSDQPLAAGNVLGVEPLVYDTGQGFGLQIKDMVAITEPGCELLSDVTDATELFVIG